MTELVTSGSVGGMASNGRLYPESMPANTSALDRLVDYRTEVISEPLPVVNPDYRHLDGKVRSATGKLTRRLANFAAMTLEEPIEPEHVEPFLRRKAALREDIETLQHELDTLKAKRKQTPHHITTDELPEEARFRQLSTTVQAARRYHQDDCLSRRNGDGQQPARAPHPSPTRHAGCSPPCTPPRPICCPTPRRGP